ncbi:MAG: septum formation initiator family protein [Altererythrobacter sp.]|nr:septum formation initiator family protein [Altererythrobacter sp.]OJU58872.1 MAG: septum formation initiator [Altererythrobacter sp. 66-12]
MRKPGELVALALLLLLGGLALMGPYGVLSWSESKALLEKRQHRIATLTAERDELKNRVKLLDPDHVDPDMASELVRKNLNVARPDEYVIQLDKMR